jgi:hypothetical protein
LIRERSSTYNSFPESNHVLAALQVINDSISRRFVKNLTPLGKSKVGESTRHKNLGSS